MTQIDPVRWIFCLDERLTLAVVALIQFSFQQCRDDLQCSAYCGRMCLDRFFCLIPYQRAGVVQTVMPALLKMTGQDVLNDLMDGRERIQVLDGLGCRTFILLIAVIVVQDGHFVRLSQIFQAVIADGDAVDIAGQIRFEHVRLSCGPGGMDHPSDLADFMKQIFIPLLAGDLLLGDVLSDQLKTDGFERAAHLAKRSDPVTMCRIDPFARRFKPAKRDQCVNVDMILHIRSKSVEYSRHAREDRFIFHLCLDRLPGCSHQDTIDC